MSAAWRTVRVFISSTFRDMHAERDHLVKVVFPALRERLVKYRVHLVDIDLRWGVTREQAENDQVTELCLKLAGECEVFLGLLGERYGWVPDEERGVSLTELEMLQGVLDPRSRPKPALFCLRDSSCVSAIPEPQRSEVFIETAAPRTERLADLKERIRRSGFRVMDPYPARWDADAYDRPSKSRGRLVDLEAFGERVREDLWQGIREALHLSDAPPVDAVTNPLAEEADDHERFMESRLRVYVGREQINDTLTAFIERDEPVACLVTGPPGSGKSAALARFVTDYRQKHPQTLVVPHFIGASPASTNPRQMLRRFCLSLKKAFGFAEDIPRDFNELATLFRGFLTRIPGERHTVFVLDALNQLDETDNVQSLNWLPRELPGHVKIIASCIDESEGHKSEPILQAFARRPYHLVPVQALEDNEQRQIIRAVPSLSAKTLDDVQVGLLLSNPATENPLFLLVALEELRGFGSFEQLDRRIVEFPHPVEQEPRWHTCLIRAKQAAGSIPDEQKRHDQLKRLAQIESALNAVTPIDDTLTAVFLQVIERLEMDFDRLVVANVLTLLAASHHGLLEQELKDLTTTQSRHDDLFIVLRQLRPYLLNRDNLIDFYHRNLAEAIARYYFATPKRETQTHTRLANYFRAQADPDRSGRWLGKEPRGFTELPHHLDRAHRDEELGAILDDLGYLDGRCSCGDTYALIDDFQRLPRADQPILEFLRRHSQRLETFKDTFFALLHHEGPATYRERADQLVRTKQWVKPWICAEAIPMPLARQTSSDEGIQILTEYDFPLSIAVGLATDVHLSFYCKRLGQIGLANIDTGRECPYTVAIHRDRPLSIFPSADGKKLAIAYETGHADWFRINYGPDGTPVGEERIRRFRYALPECEPPKLGWFGETLIYQNESGAIAQISATGNERLFQLPAGVFGELSGAVPSGNHLLLTLRNADSTTIVLFDGPDSGKVVATRTADVTSIAGCDHNRVAIGFTDRTIAVYELTSFQEIGSVIGELFAYCLATRADRLIWINSRGAFYAWQIGSQEPPVPLQLRGSALLRADSIVRARVMASRSDNTFNVVTDSNAFRCYLDSDPGETARRLQDVFQTAQGDVLALENRDAGWVLRRGNSASEIRITGADEARHRYFIAQNGEGAILALSAIGPGRFVDISSGSVSEKINMPPAVGALIGDAQGGFWLGDRSGRIYHMLQHGYREAADSKVRAARNPRLVMAGHYLIWAGSGDFEGEQGTDSFDAFVFFRCGSNKILTRIGERFCTKAYGNVADVAGDPSDNRLWTAFWGGTGHPHLLRVGTINDYIHNRVEEIPLTLFAQIDQLRITSNHIWILDIRGSLYCLDKVTRKRLAYLSPSLPISTLGVHNTGAISLVAIQHETQLLRIHFEGVS